MRPTDVRVATTAVTFRQVPFAKPLVLSSGSIDGLTEATVTADVETATGVRASGHGSVLLSHAWAYGADGSGQVDRDAQMRAMVSRLAAGIRGASGDPLTIGIHLLDELPALPLPPLAAALCAGPVDAAMHDAWARAAGRPAWAVHPRSRRRPGHLPGTGLHGPIPGRLPGPPPAGTATRAVLGRAR